MEKLRQFAMKKSHCSSEGGSSCSFFVLWSTQRFRGKPSWIAGSVELLLTKSVKRSVSGTSGHVPPRAILSMFCADQPNRNLQVAKSTESKHSLDESSGFPYKKQKKKQKTKISYISTVGSFVPTTKRFETGTCIGKII